MMTSCVQRGTWAKASSWGCLVVMATALVSGCAGGNPDSKPTAKVTGTVTYDGKPVPGGMLQFSPKGGADKKPGKAGLATIKSDGTFAVTTYNDGDGAVIGAHQLTFTAPAVEQPQAPAGAHAEAAAPPSPYAGLSPKQAEITVSKGENKIDVELVKQAASAN